MRALLCVLTVLLTTLAGPQEARAEFNKSRLWFEQLPQDQREDIQGYLVLLARYGGLVDALFGLNTYNAIAGWQQSIGAVPTGILSPQQTKLLGEEAAEVMAELGMQLVEDSRAGLSIMLPMNLFDSTKGLHVGTRYEAADGEFVAETFRFPSREGSLDALHSKASMAAPGRSVSYQTINGEFYVVSGLEEGSYFYELAFVDGGAVAGFRFTYSEAHRTAGGVASVFAASYSAPIVPGPPDNQITSAPQSPAPSLADATDEASELDHRVHGGFLTFPDYPGVIALNGEIGIETPLDFRRALLASPDANLLLLNSNGGFVASALIIAHEVHERRLNTHILDSSGCYSACAFVFLAGASRQADGELGVHQMWADEADASSVQTTLSDVLDALDEFGVNRGVTSVMLRTPPDDMYVFDKSELVSLRINSELADPEPGQGGGPAITKTKAAERPLPDTQSRFVMLSSQPSEAQAEATIDALRIRFSSILRDAEIRVVRSGLSDETVRYRVVSVHDSEEAAIFTCESIKTAGGDCFVTTP